MDVTLPYLLRRAAFKFPGTEAIVSETGRWTYRQWERNCNKRAWALSRLGIKKGEALTEEDVIEYVKTRIASFKKPKSVEFIENLPRSPAGKVLKRVLKEKWAKKGENPSGLL